ncbi:MAG: caspase domain-containing protein [Phormidesmis sp.]
MANYWAITIGINQYRHFQPLMHAQNDALSTHRFFTEDAGIPADHCILISDLSTSVAEQAVYPDKPAIAQWVQTITQQVVEGDVVWFFFSGYGTQVDGKDYLMPIDGDPNSVENTGIAAADLIETLAQLPTENALLLLDINRSQGALAGQAIGSQIIDLAEARQVTTFLSCQPEQFSHEKTIGVNHGLFTAALLEAVHQSCKTPTQISEYLNKRLPELGEDHWRPIQNPVAVIAASQARAEVVPEVQSTLNTNIAAASLSSNEDESTTSSVLSGKQAVGAAAMVGGGATAVATAPSSADGAANGELIQPPYTEETISTGSYRVQNGVGHDLPKGYDTAEEDSMAVTGAKLRNWGLLALALLMGGVLLKQPFVQTAWQGLGERIGRAENSENNDAGNGAAPSGSDASEAVPSDSEAAAAAQPSEAAPTVEIAATDSAADGLETISDGEVLPAPDEAATAAAADTEETTAEAPDADEGETSQANADASSEAADGAAQGSGEASPDSAVTSEEEQAVAQALIAQANAAIEQRQYSEALIALQEVPRSQRNSTFSAVLTKARTGSAEAQQTNASVLTEARTSIQPTQASQFTEAIAKARLIQPGEPYYEAAQRDIRSWSQVILDIAEGRATSGNLNGAIAAANVMPYDNAEFHQKAQDRIAFWQQRQNSRSIIANAQKIPKLGQASTYQKGIVKLREVPIEHPEYETAQRLADQWSQSIFSIAQARAAQGRQNAAVQAAILVPAGTTAYEPTQQAIRRWKVEE